MDMDADLAYVLRIAGGGAGAQTSAQPEAEQANATPRDALPERDAVYPPEAILTQSAMPAAEKSAVPAETAGESDIAYYLRLTGQSLSSATDAEEAASVPTQVADAPPEEFPAQDAMPAVEGSAVHVEAAGESALSCCLGLAAGQGIASEQAGEAASVPAPAVESPSEEIPAQDAMQVAEASAVLAEAEPLPRTVDLRQFNRAMPDGGDYVDGPASRWPPLMPMPGLEADTGDLRGFGVPAEALPQDLVPWSVNGWRLRLAGGTETLMEPGCEAPLREDSLRRLLADERTRRRTELTLEAWLDLQDVLDVADAEHGIPCAGRGGLARHAMAPETLADPEACSEAVRKAGWPLHFLPEALKTPEICLRAVRIHGRALAAVPAELRTPALCAEAVRQDGAALEWVPEARKTLSLCWEAVRSDGRALEHVPPALRTEAICREAVRQNGWALGALAERFRSPSLCLEAVRKDGPALRLVPEPLKTADLCAEAVRRDGLALAAVPERQKTETLCLAAVKRRGLALRFVPDALMTKAICLEAVRQTARAMEEMPTLPKTREFCLEAVQQNSAAMDFMPDALMTPDFCMEAVQANAQAFRSWRCPRTPALCLEAVKRDWRLLRFVPPPLRTPDQCSAAVRQDGRALADVPHRLKTAKLCAKAVEGCWEALKFVPAELKTEELCLEAIRQNARAFVDCMHARTPAICMEAVKRDGLLLRFVPPPNRCIFPGAVDLRTKDLCLAAVRQNGLALEFVPKELKTPEICLEAVWQNGDARRFVPDGVRWSWTAQRPSLFGCLK